ncbi:MAG: DUF4834 family protein [Bacteroidia bacterium]|nr:DUF4834 family protein [Bacteroidia bacterium]
MMQFASLQGFLRTILIILLIYYGLKIISRFLTPFLVKYLSKKAEKRFGQEFGQQGPPKHSKHKEGETVIDKMPESSSNSKKEIGEYVDYEEID